MSAHAAALTRESTRLNLVTVASIAVVACVSADMVHEVLGHGTAALLTGDRILSLPTVAIQNAAPNRFVSAAGTVANCMVGALALLLLRRSKSFTSSACFLWIFGALNLLNSGYVIASGLMNSGDWANVVAGLSPPWLWRCILLLLGTMLYVFSIRAAANSMIRFVESGAASLPDTKHLVWCSYLAAGVVMTIASIFNPISRGLILVSGVGASFGLNAGLLFLPGIVAGNAKNADAVAPRVPFSLPWLVSALIFSGVFIAILGPGIHFAR